MDGHEMGVEDAAGAGMAAPMWSYGSSILQLTNPERVLEKLELDLRGLRRTEEGVQRVGDALLNELGVSRMIGHASSLVNQVTIMSNLTKRDVWMLMQNYSEAVVKDLMVSRVRYDILSPANVTRNTVWSLLMQAAYPCVKRAYEGDDKRFWKGSQVEYTTRVENSGGGRRGFMDMLPRFGARAP